VIENRDAVACAWLLPLSVPLHEDGVLDVLAALLTATRAIRHVRSYVIALSDWDCHCHHSAPKEGYRSKVAARNAKRRVLPATPPLAGYSLPEDELRQARNAALEVPATLKKLEECARFPFIDDAYDAHSE
jgi:hypothetical protein